MKSFADLLEQYFFEAATSDGLVSRHFEIAGSPISFRFAGDRRSDEMTRAMAHLEVPCETNRAASLTVSVWDGKAEPGNHLLRAYLFTLTNWWFSYTGKRGELLDIHTERLSATFHPDTGTLSVVDLDNNRAFYWKQDDAPMPYYEACAPFRSLLHSWMRNRDSYFVHGAAIGTAAGGILLVGKGGSGKSTTTLSCLDSALQVAGDDYCIVRQNATGSYEAHSLYCTAKLIDVENLPAFPGLADSVINSQRALGEKVAFSLLAHHEEKLLRQFPLQAVLVPVITGETETTTVPCSSQDALMALAPSTLSQLPASGQADLQFLGKLSRSLPCFRILLGTDLRRIPDAIAELLKTTREQSLAYAGSAH